MFRAVFADILVAPPYNFRHKWIGFLFFGQVILLLFVVLAQGWLSDWVVERLGMRNDGLAGACAPVASSSIPATSGSPCLQQPESRVIPLVIPFVVVISSTIIFGRASNSPQGRHWSAIVVTFNAEFYGFLGVVVSSFTYVIDCDPRRSDVALVVLGVISFGLPYGPLNFLGAGSSSYALLFDVCLIILRVLGLLGFFVYLWGKEIRQTTQKWAVDKTE